MPSRGDITTTPDLEDSLFAAAVLFSAYMVRGLAGFGSGLVAIPLLALRFPLVSVVPLVVLLDYLGSAAQGAKGRKDVAWRDLVPLLPFTIAGIACALALLGALDALVLRRALGVFVLVFAVYQLLPLPALRGSRLMSAPYGLLGGLVGTLFGTGGPFYVMYLQLRGLDKVVFRASFAAWFIVDGSIRLVGYGLAGYFGRAELTAALLALPVAGAGLLIGGRIHTGIEQATFKRVISALLVFSGIALLTR